MRSMTDEGPNANRCPLTRPPFGGHPLPQGEREELIGLSQTEFCIPASRISLALNFIRAKLIP